MSTTRTTLEHQEASPPNPDLLEGVRDWENQFLALFPHRYDFIWAEHANPGSTIEWKTERRYPLCDRQIVQGSFLYGVRFGAKTNYVLLDIDAGSLYHPRRDPFAIQRMIDALEPLGLVSYLACTSSYSGGIHLYLPFDESQSSWQLSIALSTLLENAGFILKPGQLELFPNPKPYRHDGTFSLFNAHRLPLQIGSYLLNSDFQPIWGNQTTFVQHWAFMRSRNLINAAAIKRVLRQFKRQPFYLSGKADKYLNDLNAEIEVGWTGFGQTNRLLGRIAMRAYVFHHVIAGGRPLSGQALVDEIVRVAKSLPGYEDWCRHQHEIEHRAKEWARCVEASRYFHYGDVHGKYKAQPQVSESRIKELPNWNQQQAESAREKIRNAIADLLDKQSLPSAATERFKKLLQYRIGGGSLYRHKDLWHPQFLSLESEPLESEALKPDVLNHQSRTSSFIQPKAQVKNAANCSPSLLPGNGGNVALVERFKGCSQTGWGLDRKQRIDQARVSYVGVFPANASIAVDFGGLENLVFTSGLWLSISHLDELLPMRLQLPTWLDKLDALMQRFGFTLNELKPNST